jgi:A/G-specific adenine glycosylase
MAPKSTPPSRLHSAFRRKLIAWFERSGRDLPWRRTRDPYRVLVSEIMLQQTQVPRVTGYYARFLETFPTVHHLARARPARVREAWDGLGYYRRAANLHRLAREVVAQHDGELPDDPAALVQLAGIGRYTAVAVACFAYQKAVPLVDTNVARVLRRAFHPGLGKNARGSRKLWDTAAALQRRHGRSAWTFNQALMELGAVVCTARVALCSKCPVARQCMTGKKEVGARRQREGGSQVERGTQGSRSPDT